MKNTIDDLPKTYKFCLSAGNIKEKAVDLELIKSLKLVAEKGLEFINSISKTIPKDSSYWTFVFREHYESLRGLVEAICYFMELKQIATNVRMRTFVSNTKNWS